MCEEETTSEPSSPPVESTAKEHDAGAATTVISDSESPLIQQSHTHTESAPSPAPQVQHLLVAAASAPQVQQQPEGFLDIWADTADTGYAQMKKLLGDEKCKWYVAVDTEFCMKDDVVDPWGPPQSPDGHYEQTRRIVDEGDLVQVGFALAKSSSGLDPNSFRVFQFNMLFQYTARSSTSKNVRFLRDTAKLNLDDHASRGINIKDFINGIRTLGILENRNITWITFQGYSDFGYLIRALQDSSVLAHSRAEFVRLAKRYFRSSYDLKLLLSLGVRCQKPSRSVPGSGSLKGLAASLGVKRSGQEHGSGSDAHLTLGCFRHLMLSDRAASSELRCYKNTIYGVENPLPGTSGANADADQVDVWASNFDTEIRIITGSLDVQGLLTVEVEFTNSTINHIMSYAEVRTEASRCKADLAIGISDNNGRLAYGRVWTFHVEAQQGAEDEQGRVGVTATMLAGLLTNMRSLQNPNVIWLSSTRMCFLYLISLLTRCLPLEEHCFFGLWNCFFPNWRLIEHGSPEQDPGRRAIITLQRCFQPYSSHEFRFS
ncbi:poly(A) ribonuclease POP2-like [Aegilops tauschii subsp. strangulata]|uniref:Putative CCR4-associated factor 1-10-like protein n=1 Tax=Aegilops tauschii TaxID=37682 RepID=M8AM80_AEGTA|nr:uncharacterized protein LOC109775409 [Aegilops tauschii subsp. strangulata]